MIRLLHNAPTSHKQQRHQLPCQPRDWRRGHRRPVSAAIFAGPATGKEKPEDWAAFVEKILVAQGQKIVKEGKALETQQEHLAELTSQANDFSMKQLPILKALQVARDS